MLKSLDPEVYRKAAKTVNHWGACTAIQDAYVRTFKYASVSSPELKAYLGPFREYALAHRPEEPFVYRSVYWLSRYGCSDAQDNVLRRKLLNDFAETLERNKWNTLKLLLRKLKL